MIAVQKILMLVELRSLSRFHPVSEFIVSPEIWRRGEIYSFIRPIVEKVLKMKKVNLDYLQMK